VSADRLHGLRILVLGVDAPISRDVVRAIVAEGALVTAAAADERVLARLQRDLGVYRTTADIACIDLASPSEMRLFAINLEGLGKLPHLIVCCCAAAACPMPLASARLQPSFDLHVLPRVQARLGRALASLVAPPLPLLLERAERRGLFDVDAGPRRVMIAGHVFGFCRWVAPTARPPAPRSPASADQSARAPRNRRISPRGAVAPPQPGPEGQRRKDAP
jgi:NAD(P)-dependent dehydrogenase (short-subunit alcohol dehydrogenase family)